MVGGLIQLMHIGSEGNMFIGNPEIQFFKKIYKGYMNFAMEYKEIPINSINFNNFDDFFEQRGFAELPILGDMISKSYLKLNLDFYVNNFDLDIILNEYYIRTTGLSNKIELINNNNLLFEGECIYFDTDINDTSSPPNELIKKNTKYTIKNINGNNIELVEIDNTKIFKEINSDSIKIYNIHFESGNNGIIYEDVYNKNEKEIYLYNYKYNIRNNNGLTINFYEIKDDSLGISEIKQINNTIDLIKQNKKIYYKIVYLDYNFTGELLIKIIKEDITKIIKEISFEIDEYIIEKHNTKWLLTYDKLFNNNETKNIINNNIKFITSDLFNKKLILYIPLRFTFCNNINNSLPIAALFNSYNYIRIKTNTIKNSFITSKIINKTKSKFNNVSFLLNYIYIEPENREYFLKNKQTLLIEQIQNQYEKIYNGKLNKIDLRFTNLSKILIWTLDYKYILKEGNIKFNNEIIIDNFDGEYYHLIQPLEHNLGNTESFTKMELNTDINGTYYMYSFSLYPNNVQPSGLCNMSRINDKVLELNTEYILNHKNINKEIYTSIYSINYNYLIISNGKGKLQYF
tara:strand:- start:419 stop:2137 length:1719 start_codon:yes stop_codon:yes gene_type:complete